MASNQAALDAVGELLGDGDAADGGQALGDTFYMAFMGVLLSAATILEAVGRPMVLARSTAADILALAGGNIKRSIRKATTAAKGNTVIFTDMSTRTLARYIAGPFRATLRERHSIDAKSDATQSW